MQIVFPPMKLESKEKLPTVEKLAKQVNLPGLNLKRKNLSGFSINKPDLDLDLIYSFQKLAITCRFISHGSPVSVPGNCQAWDQKIQNETKMLTLVVFSIRATWTGLRYLDQSSKQNAHSGCFLNPGHMDRPEVPGSIVAASVPNHPVKNARIKQIRRSMK